VRGTARSIQLTMARSPSVVSCGAELESAAGEGNGSIVSGQSESAGAEDGAGSVASAASAIRPIAKRSERRSMTLILADDPLDDT
jgi:hypothetical protein